MTITSSTPIANVTPDLMDTAVPINDATTTAEPTNVQPTNAPATSVADVMTSINTTLKTAGGAYTDYSCKTVSWDDVTRGTVGGSLSSWGANITDTRLYEKSGKQLYTVRSENFNEKLGKVNADELALITGNQQPGGDLTPITLRDFLKNMGKHGAYAGLDKNVSLGDKAADAEVSIRFMTTFLPVNDEELATLEFAPEMYQYQTRSEDDPANLLLLATTQGVAVQANGAGATKLYHHAVEPSKQICRYWFEAERSTKKVGGAQLETKEEAQAAAQRGKATASVIGTRSMGTRFNVLMTIQVPLKQKPQPKPRGMTYGMGGGMGMLLGGMGGGMKKSMPMQKMMMMPMSASAPMMGGGAEDAFMSAFMDSDDDLMEGAEEEAGCMFASPVASAMSAPPPPMMAMKRSRGSSMTFKPKVGTANAARVSRGSMVDKLNKTVKIAKPTRDPSQHVTVTVVIYNTVAGGVPSMEDVKAAVDDMEQLYASCGWKGRLAEQGADFMKKELTVKNVMDISEKLTTQPYVPPVEQNMVTGGNVFPTSVA